MSFRAGIFKRNLSYYLVSGEMVVCNGIHRGAALLLVGSLRLRGNLERARKLWLRDGKLCFPLSFSGYVIN